MYSWGDDTSDWAKPGAYQWDSKRKEARAADAHEARARGPRTYDTQHGPALQLIDPRKRIRSLSPNPLMIAVDVTGSMQTWPAEIFDRLPLLYQTLSQYRPDLEVSFAAIGDAVADRWPLQVTEFSKGYALESHLKALYGEGGGGDLPESYGLFAYWALTHVEVPQAERPFLIVFGDAPMHAKVRSREIQGLLGDKVVQDVDAVTTWINLTRTWNVWFLRRPGGSPDDETAAQWKEALGDQQVVPMDDEQRAVDWAMGLIARSWGHFEDFRSNMAARQDPSRIQALVEKLQQIKEPRLLACPHCGAPLRGTVGAVPSDRVTCVFCKSLVQLPPL